MDIEPLQYRDALNLTMRELKAVLRDLEAKQRGIDTQQMRLNRNRKLCKIAMREKAKMLMG